MELQVKTLAGETAGTVTVSDEVFGLEPRADILHRMVRYQELKRQQGTHKTKGRSEVKATSKKMYKQKGTGGARHGSRRAPQFVGGSRAFGPVVRSHAFDLPKKVRAMALRHALSSKAKAGTLVVLDTATLDSPKTAALRERFGALGWKSALIIAGAEVDNNLKLAARNIPQVDVLPNAGLNVYDVLRREKLVLTRDAVEAITSRLTEEAA